MKTFYQQLVSIQTGSEATKAVKDSTPYLTITFHRNTDLNKEVKIEYIPYDDNYYLVNSNGINYFLTDSRAIEELLTSVSTLGESNSAE